jgi:hypothetical protein
VKDSVAILDRIKSANRTLEKSGIGGDSKAEIVSEVIMDERLKTNLVKWNAVGSGESEDVILQII